MVNINLIACILYVVISVANMLGYINIDNANIFGMTVGTLFLCIAPLFPKKQEKMKFINYFIAGLFIIGFPLFKDSLIIANNSETNTWLLLSLAVTFLSNFMSDINKKRSKVEDDNEKLKKDREDIKKLRDKLKNNKF